MAGWAVKWRYVGVNYAGLHIGRCIYGNGSVEKPTLALHVWYLSETNVAEGAGVQAPAPKLGVIRHDAQLTLKEWQRPQPVSYK